MGGALLLGAILGIVAAVWLPWLKRHKGDTEFLVKQTGNRIRFYVFPMLVGSILVAVAVLNVNIETVTGFKMIEEKGQVVGPRDYQLFDYRRWLAGLIAGYAFINPSLQRANERRKEFENHKPPLG